jgi:hypothetical protein
MPANDAPPLVTNAETEGGKAVHTQFFSYTNQSQVFFIQVTGVNVYMFSYIHATSVALQRN